MLEVKELIVFSDIHSSTKFFDQYIYLKNKFPESQFVFNGDFCDRGYETREVIEFLYSEYMRNNLLMTVGNHDEVFFDTFGYTEIEDNKWIRSAFLSLVNGGFKSFIQAFNYYKEDEIVKEIEINGNKLIQLYRIYKSEIDNYDFKQLKDKYPELSNTLDKISNDIKININNIKDTDMEINKKLSLLKKKMLNSHSFRIENKKYFCFHSGVKDTWAELPYVIDKLNNSNHFTIMGHWGIKNTEYCNGKNSYLTYSNNKHDCKFKFVDEAKLFLIDNSDKNNFVIFNGKDEFEVVLNKYI